MTSLNENPVTGSSDITLVRGDTVTIVCVVKTPDGSVKNITGYTPTLTVKSSPDLNDSLAMFQITGTLTDPTNGVCTFTISAAQMTIVPNTYYYDIQISRAAATTPIVVTQDVKTVVTPSKFIVAWDVTRTVAT